MTLNNQTSVALLDQHLAQPSSSEKLPPATDGTRLSARHYTEALEQSALSSTSPSNPSPRGSRNPHRGRGRKNVRARGHGGHQENESL